MIRAPYVIRLSADGFVGHLYLPDLSQPHRLVIHRTDAAALHFWCQLVHYISLVCSPLFRVSQHNGDTMRVLYGCSTHARRYYSRAVQFFSLIFYSHSLIISLSVFCFD